MSRSRSTEDKADNSYTTAVNQLQQLLQSGRSFSGKERNCCYLNLGTKSTRYGNVSAIAGFDFPDDCRGLVTTDWDQDGDLDVWVSNRNAPRLRFLENNLAIDAHFMTLLLEGNGTTTSRDAIGARVEIVDPAQKDDTAESLKQIFTVKANDGFLSQSSKSIHVGLGAAKNPQTAIVRWPDGAQETFANLQVDHAYRLQQGAGKAVQLPDREDKLAIEGRPIPPSSSGGGERIPLLTLMKLPQLKFENTDGAEEVLPLGQGKPVLINLWATWCGPCKKELADFAKEKNRLAENGIEVVALSMDKMGAAESSPEGARKFMEQIKFPYTFGFATQDFVSVLQQIHDILIFGKEVFPAPTSFLIDGEGRLAVIYKGPVSVDQVIEDCGHSEKSLLDRYAATGIPAGTTTNASSIEANLQALDSANCMTLSDMMRYRGDYDASIALLYSALQNKDDALVRTNLGGMLMDQERFAEAELHLREAINLNPKLAKAHNNLGMLLWRQGNVEDANSCFHEALECDPDLGIAYVNLGLILADKGEFEAAAKQYDLAISVDPKLVSAYQKKGNLLAVQGQFAEALAAYRQALEIMPNDINAHLAIGKILMAQGNPAAAEKQLRQILKVAPENQEARQHLSKIERQKSGAP